MLAKAKKDQSFLDDPEQDFLDESIGSDIQFNKADVDNRRRDPKFSSVPNPNRNGLNTDS